MRLSPPPYLLLLSLLALGGCAAPGANDDDAASNDDDAASNDDDAADDDDDDTPDTTGPSVLSTSPADGDTGVYEDATVQFVFSEAMDTASVEAALDTAELGEVALSWNATGDTLTVTPATFLLYAEGTGGSPAAIDPVRYRVELEDSATDAAGNGILNGGAEVTFTTMKAMTNEHELHELMTGSGTAGGGVDSPEGTLHVGDNDNAEGIRGFVTMDLWFVSTTAVEVVEATLTARMYETAGLPWSLGDLILDHGIYEAFDNAAFNLQPLSEVGVFATDGDVALSIDVTSQVDDDVKNRQERDALSQYRLRFETINNEDGVADLVYLSRDAFVLEITYLAH
ncbi:MAG: Ig-like domain-containing protein [Deltaproteobacteria bacterium]|nr:Ig-like domain-containing protein [Deltaproteobacteria bacterium]